MTSQANVEQWGISKKIIKFITYKVELHVPHSILPKYRRRTMYGELRKGVHEIY